MQLANTVNSTPPMWIDILVYKNFGIAGALGAPSDADQWANQPDSTTIILRKKAKIYFTRVLLTDDPDTKEITIPIKKKYLREGESIRIFIESRTTGTHTCYYQIYGRMYAKQA